MMLLSLDSVSRECDGLSKSTIRRRIRDGALPAVKIGRRVLVSRDALEAFVREHQTSPAEPARLVIACGDLRGAPPT